MPDSQPNAPYCPSKIEWLALELRSRIPGLLAQLSTPADQIVYSVEVEDIRTVHFSIDFLSETVHGGDPAKLSKLVYSEFVVLKQRLGWGWAGMSPID